jgi:predicted dienelactone hydrolase
VTRSYVVASVIAVGTGLCSAAGFEPIEIPATDNAPAIQAVIWTPCAQAPGRIDLGPFTLQGSRNCPVQGRALPLVVISHGNRGTRFGHHDTATALAEAGFVAVSFNHPGNSFGSNDAEQSPAVFESRVTGRRPSSERRRPARDRLADLCP